MDYLKTTFTGHIGTDVTLGPGDLTYDHRNGTVRVGGPSYLPGEADEAATLAALGATLLSAKTGQFTTATAPVPVVCGQPWARSFAKAVNVQAMRLAVDAVREAGIVRGLPHLSSPDEWLAEVPALAQKADAAGLEPCSWVLLTSPSAAGEIRGAHGGWPASVFPFGPAAAAFSVMASTVVVYDYPGLSSPVLFPTSALVFAWREMSMPGRVDRVEVGVACTDAVEFAVAYERDPFRDAEETARFEQERIVASMESAARSGGSGLDTDTDSLKARIRARRRLAALKSS